MLDASGDDGADEVGLVEEVLAVGGVVVRRDGDRGAGGIHGAGEDVLVELVVVGEARGVAHGETVAEVVVECGTERADGRGDRTLGRIAEERFRSLRHRAAQVGRDATVGDALVVEVFETGAERGARGELDGEGGVGGVSEEREAVAVAGGILVEGVDPHGEAVGDRLADVEGGPVLLPGADGEGELADRGGVGLLGDTVDEAARTAAAEDHGVGALDGLDAVHVVEVAEVLDVVAHAIDKETRGRAVAAEHRRVAVALTLGDADAGHVADHVAHAAHGLVVDQLAGDDGDGLGDIEQGRLGLGCRCALPGLITGGGALAAVDLHLGEHDGISVHVVDQGVVLVARLSGDCGHQRKGRSQD